MTTLISRDITLKLYSMNAKLRRTVDGANLDIRLPGIAGRLSEMDTRQLAKFNSIQKSEEDKSVQEKAMSVKSKKSGKKDNRTIEFAPPLLIPIHKKKKSKWVKCSVENRLVRKGRTVLKFNFSSEFESNWLKKITVHKRILWI